MFRRIRSKNHAHKKIKRLFILTFCIFPLTYEFDNDNGTLEIKLYDRYTQLQTLMIFMWNGCIAILQLFTNVSFIVKSCFCSAFCISLRLKSFYSMYFPHSFL